MARAETRRINGSGEVVAEGFSEQEAECCSEGASIECEPGWCVGELPGDAQMTPASLQKAIQRHFLQPGTRSA